MAEPQATFLVEFGCERRCVVERDTSDADPRHTHRQFLRQAEVAHDAAHAAEPPVRVFAWHETTLVKAGAL